MYRGNEHYVELIGTLEKRTLHAVLIKTPLGAGWIARSFLSYRTNTAVDMMREGDKSQFRVMEWAAQTRGLM